MGTYGPGEIGALCDWCPPEVAVLTAVGPVHLERMGSLDVIDAAKFEITERASTVVVNVDDPRLARWVARLLAQGRRVRTAGSRTPDAAVRVVQEAGRWRLLIDGDVVADVDAVVGLQATNVACAVAAALDLGVDPHALATRLSHLRAVSNRAQVVTAPSGVKVIDDTFNANPASARAALALLSSLAVSGRRVVVTPGMVELGSLQYGENIVLAQQVLAHGAELVVVGRTNAVPLSVGAERRAVRVDTRDEAVAWVRSTLGPGDAVLYLNDLPDHYP
jgi:UDP-N-acetylmuramoyl-tripeptide--D-alanyl-D-alanine ligase